ncbi:MAG: hypothetical protein COA79_11525 [Planctomycetota bacterium]|nr:MAG: hypothetical protein COA79_11525 [Planctomycetota bacterium]
MANDFQKHIKILENLLVKADLTAADSKVGQKSLKFISENVLNDTNKNHDSGDVNLENKLLHINRIVKANTKAIKIFKKIEPLFEGLIEQNIYTEDLKLSVYYSKVEDFLLQVPDGEWDKDSGTRFLSDLLSLLTRIRHLYDHVIFKDLRADLTENINYVVDLLLKRNVVVLPENMNTEEIEWESKNFSYCCSLKPKGYLISIKAYTLKIGEKLLCPGEVVISCGYKSQIYDFLKNLEYVLLKNRDKFYSEYWNNNLKKFKTWCDLIADDKKFEKEENYKYLRYAIQVFYNIDLSEVKKYLEKAELLLDKIGIKIINIEINIILKSLNLDEDSVEIKEVESNERKGMVIKLVSPGFAQEDGSILQKAIVQVSKGRLIES